MKQRKHAVNGRYKKRLNTYVIAYFYILGAIRLALIVWPPNIKTRKKKKKKKSYPPQEQFYESAPKGGTKPTP